MLTIKRTCFIGGIFAMQVTNLRTRGVQFLDVPDNYYTNLKERLRQSPVSVKEDIDMVRNGRTRRMLSGRS